ncbi:MAG: hypothetical protein Q9171_002544 [Xanthocarpia ochracea]
MPATYTKISQSNTTTIPISTKKTVSRSGLLGGFLPNNAQSPPKRTSTTPVKVRGVVGKDPGELSIRASMARKKAFEIESLENGDYGADHDIDELDEEDSKDLEDLRFMMSYACQDLMGDEENHGLLLGEKKQKQPGEDSGEGRGPALEGVG